MYPMLRSERKMDDEKVKEFLIEAKVGRLGLSQNNEAYVVPVIYIYDSENEVIYIHSAKKGRKNDMIKSNPKVCFEVDELFGLVTGSSPCENDQIYRSVITFGEANFLHDPSMKAKVLNMIVKKYAYSKEKNRASVTTEKAEGTQIIVIKVLSKSGKENKGKTIPYRLTPSVKK